MRILGLHKDPWHNTGAAALSGEASRVPHIVQLAEERLDRIKDSRAFPALSTAACMRTLGIAAPEDFDMVVLDHIMRPALDDCYKMPCRSDTFLNALPPEKIHIINHHLAHAAAVFYSSPYKEAAILIIDGRGSEKETQSLFIGTDKDIKLIARTTTIGIGLLYAAVTQAIGFGLLQEGKTMGLAPYGANIDKKILDIPQSYDGIVTDYSAICVDGNYDLKGAHAPIETFEDKARAAFEVQQECESAMLHLAAFAKAQTGMEYLCISGGVALNSVANNTIMRDGIFKDIFINPAASDTGIPLGCALYGYHAIARQPRLEGALSAYLGPDYSEDDDACALDNVQGIKVIERGAEDVAAELLAKNYIVACCRGRSEMGPRSLGNRSILMSPLKAENKDVLNSRVKHRESFRPFAPAVMAEFTQDYFAIDRESPFMLLVPETREEKRAVIPAVTHIDGTARLQTVSENDNALFYALIRAFYEKTGVPVLLNTSFNVAGEPIVETPADAVRCFLGTEIDALLLGSRIAIKENVWKKMEAHVQATA